MDGMKYKLSWKQFKAFVDKEIKKRDVEGLKIDHIHIDINCDDYQIGCPFINITFHDNTMWIM